MKYKLQGPAAAPLFRGPQRDADIDTHAHSVVLKCFVCVCVCVCVWVWVRGRVKSFNNALLVSASQDTETV